MDASENLVHLRHPVATRPLARAEAVCGADVEVEVEVEEEVETVLATKRSLRMGRTGWAVRRLPGYTKPKVSTCGGGVKKVQPAVGAPCGK